MNEVLEILNAYAAVATIISLLHDLWTDHKKSGRSRGKQHSVLFSTNFMRASARLVAWRALPEVAKPN